MRVAVIGAGAIARPHVAAWTSLGAHVRIHSSHGAPALARAYGGTAVDTLEECLDGVEVVDVCTPTPTHAPIVLAAAARRLHVVCEKPLALDHRTAAGLIDACRDAGVRLFPGHVVRYFPAYAAAHRLVTEQGTVGRVAVTRLSRTTMTPSAPWLTDPARSGGVLVDQMIHDFDFARWIAGPVVDVFARLTGGPPWTGHALLRHESGALTQVTGQWGRPGTAFRTSFAIRGSSGGLDHDSRDTAPLRWEPEPPADALLPAFDATGSPFRAELADFVTALRTGAPARVTPEDSLAALDVALAAVRSVRENRPVDPKEVAA